MPRLGQHSELAPEIYKVFLSTSKSTFLFLKCQPETLISELQGDIARVHETLFPEHGKVRCKRLLTSLNFGDKHSYAVPEAYCMLDIRFSAHIFGDATCVFELQAELTSGQAVLRDEQDTAPEAAQLQVHPGQPLLALPGSSAQVALSAQPAGVPQPTASPGPAESALLHSHAAVPLPEQGSEQQPKKRKKRKHEPDAAAAAHAVAEAQQDDKECEQDGADDTTTKQKKRKKKSRAESETPDEVEPQPAKKKKKEKRKHEATPEDASAAADDPQPVAETDQQQAPEPAPGKAAAADAGEALNSEAVDAASKKSKKKKKKRRHTSAETEEAVVAEDTAAAEAAQPATEATAAAADDKGSEDGTAAEASAESTPTDDAGRPAGSKKKKKKKGKKKKIRKSKQLVSDAEPSSATQQAAGEEVEAAAALAAAEIAAQASPSHRSKSGADQKAGDAVDTAAGPAPSDTSHRASLQTSSRKNRHRKSLAEAAAAYGMTLPAELANDEPGTGSQTGDGSGQDPAAAQDDNEEQAEPNSSGWKKSRRRELLPELDAAEDKLEDNQDPDTEAAGLHDAHTASDAPHATDSKTKARVNAAIASVSKLANGHMTLKSDPDREGLPNQAVGDTANSRSSNPPDALALMPDIPPGMVSPDDGSQQQQAGYGESSTSEDSSAGSGDEEEEPAEAVPDQDWAGHEEEQGVRAQAPNGQASHANGEGGAQGAISSDSFRPSSSSDDEDAVQQQPDQEAAEANGVAGPDNAAAEDSSSADSSSDSDDEDDQDFRIQGADFPPGGTEDELTQPDMPDNGRVARMPNDNAALHARANGVNQPNIANGHRREGDGAGDEQPNGNLQHDREDESSSGDSDNSDSEDEQPPDLLNAGSATRKQSSEPGAPNPFKELNLVSLLAAASKARGLESARGLATEEQDEGIAANSRPNRRRHLVNPMTAVVAQREAEGPSQAPSQKKRGRPAKGSFTVTEDSDLLDQVARRPVQDWGPAIKQASVLKRAVKAWLNEDRVARGLKEVHSNIYQQNAPPEWWPLQQWDSSQIERKAPCQQVYAALQKYMRDNRQHQGTARRPTAQEEVVVPQRA